MTPNSLQKPRSGRSSSARSSGARLVLALLLAAAGPKAASEGGLPVVLPSIAGQGSASVASAAGYEALLSNPAGFRSEGGQFTLLSVSPWMEGALPAEDLEGSMRDRAAEGGLRFGSTAGLGYVGRGLGLGLALLTAADIAGSEPLGGLADFELRAIAGYAYALHPFGLDLALGAAVRPMIRARIPLDDDSAERLLSQAASGGLGAFQALWMEDALYGTAIALDLGARLDLGSLHLGLAVTDVGGTTFRFARGRFGDVVTSLASFAWLPEGASSDETATVPMQWRLGAAVEVASALELQAELVDPAAVLSRGTDALDNLRLGVRLGRRRALWLGLDGLVRLSVGGRLALGPVELALALYGIEPSEGWDAHANLVLETAIRF